MLDPGLSAACLVALEEAAQPGIPSGSSAVIIPAFLADDEIDAIIAAGERGSDSLDSEGPLRAFAHDYVFPAACGGCRGVHVVRYMHRGGYFGRTLPALLSKLTRRMHACSVDESASLNVRCVELHTYAAGGGLLTPRHRDEGSSVTVSVMLSRPGDLEGGQFVTYGADGAVTMHQMARGDAIVFRSEELHNVCTVTRGIRRSLVVELWRAPANVRDRLC
jgi:hypothetical protein